MEGACANKLGIHMFMTRYAKTQTIARQLGSGRNTIVTKEAIVEAQIREDDKTTAIQFHQPHCPVLRCQTTLGWTFLRQHFLSIDSDCKQV